MWETNQMDVVSVVGVLGVFKRRMREIGIARLPERACVVPPSRRLPCWSHLTRAKEDGGESGIRTHGRVSPTHAFQACSFNHSDISPFDSLRSQGQAAATTNPF